MIAPSLIALLGCCAAGLAACASDSGADQARDTDAASDTAGSFADTSERSDADDTELPALGDTAAPIPGDGGGIEVSGLTDAALVLTWAPAADDLTDAASLRYSVYQSSDHALATLEDIDRHGVALAAHARVLQTLEITGLDMGHTYHFNVVVEDAVGRRSAYAGVEVHTLFRKVEVVRSVYYQTGTMIQYWDLTFDADGLWTRRTIFMGSGGDAAWFTPDDEIGGAETRTYTPDHQLESETDYLDAGPDGAWLGADDTPAGKRVNRYDEAGNLEREAFYQGDDVVNGYQRHDYDAAQRRTRTTIYSSPGYNGRWFDADDGFGGCYAFAWDGERLVRTDNVGVGPDRRIGTDDDVINNSKVITYDSEGRALEERWIDSAGPDGVWFTDDDTIVQLITWERSGVGDGTRLLEVTYNGPGPDGAWRTSDDSANIATLTDRDAQGRQILYAVFTGPLAAGADGQYGTSDDASIWYYTTTSYDEAGREVASHARMWPGADGLWWTDDDVVTTATAHAYADDGTLVATERSYPGPDGVPLTADDVLDQRIEYGVIYSRDPSPVLTR